MFILIFILNLLIKPVYAQEVTVAPIAIEVVIPTETPIPTSVPLPTPTDIPVTPLVPTPTVDMTVVTPTPAPIIILAPTAVEPTPTDIPATPTPIIAFIIKYITPVPVAQVPAPVKIVNSVKNKVKDIFAPDVIFPASFLKFEKDGNFYKPTQVSPSQARLILFAGLLLIVIGLGLVTWDKALILLATSELTTGDNIDYTAVRHEILRSELS